MQGSTNPGTKGSRGPRGDPRDPGTQWGTQGIQGPKGGPRAQGPGPRASVTDTVRAPRGPLKGEQGENRGIFTHTPNSYIFGFLGGVLGAGRHIGGILGPMGSILVEYEPEPSHMDLIRTIFHDFVLNLAF